MNHEVLFRGKSVETNEWVYGSYILEKYSNTPYICYFEYGTFVNIKQVEVIPETVGQYIGLNDKQNKPIFEGDIAEVDARDDVFLVKYDEDDAIWFISNCNDNLSFRENISNYNCVVIGNIYDNPELLPDYLR